MARYMNPYNFVRLRPMAEGARQVPLGHKRLVSEYNGEPVYTGRLHGLLTAFGPLMVLSHDPTDVIVEPQKHLRFTRFFHYPGDERPVIPGSSLKGMVRSVAEAACNSCLSVLNEDYVKRWDNFRDAYPPNLHFCGGLDTSGAFCPTCRIFGTAPEQEGGTSERGAYPQAFQGKVRFSDAIFQGDVQDIYSEQVTLRPLLDPKVSDRVWYKDPERGSPVHPLAGRKFYYHHDDLKPKMDNQATKFNRTVNPLKPGATFTFQVDFRNLLESELNLLLYALEMEPAQALVQMESNTMAFAWQDVKEQQGVYPKLGYGKPVGLGSVCLLVAEMVLLDPTARYGGGGEGQRRLVGPEVRQVVEAQKQRFQASQTLIQDDKRCWLAHFSDLRNILRFPNNVYGFRYPSLDEFRRYREQAIPLRLPGREEQRGR